MRRPSINVRYWGGTSGKHREQYLASVMMDGFVPKDAWRFPGIDFESFPPRNLIAGLMKLPVIASAEWRCELIADFKADGSRLSKPQMMRVARLPTQIRHGCEATNFRWTLSRKREEA